MVTNTTINKCDGECTVDCTECGGRGQEVSTNSTLEELSRITKKNNK